MTLKQKREIVQRFKRGANVKLIATGWVRKDGSVDYYMSGRADEIEQALRDFLNGKFELEQRPVTACTSSTQKCPACGKEFIVLAFHLRAEPCRSIVAASVKEKA